MAEEVVVMAVDQNVSEGKKEKKSPPTLSLWAIFGMTRTGRVMAIIGAICAVISGSVLPGLSLGLKSVLDVLYKPAAQLKDEIWGAALVLVALGFIQLVFNFINNITFGRAAFSVTQHLRTKVYSSILGKKSKYADETQSGELISLLTEGGGTVVTGISEKLGAVLQWIGAVLAGFVIALVYGWKLTVLLVLLAPIVMVVLGVQGKFLKNIAALFITANANANVATEEVISNLQTVASFNQQRHEATRYERLLGQVRKLGYRKALVTGTGMGTMFLVMMSMFACVFAYGGYLVADGEMEPGDVLAVFFALMIAIGHAQSAQMIPDVIKAQVVAAKLMSIVARVDMDEVDNALVAPCAIGGDIELRNICFRYPARPDAPVLENVSFAVPRFTNLALVGPSGGGKSTVLKLITRLYEADSGSVLVDGKDVVTGFQLESLRSQVSMVMQEPVLFSGSILDNILYGVKREGLSQGTLTAQAEFAAKQADAFDFVSKLPKGFATEVGEGGTQLSGGQKQRIAIARALAKKPKILILDEATSSLDTQSELEVQQTLDAIMRLQTMTVIVVAHRLSTVQDAKKIVFVNHGVIGQGTHSGLLESCPEYRKLVENQMIKPKDESGPE